MTLADTLLIVFALASVMVLGILLQSLFRLSRPYTFGLTFLNGSLTLALLAFALLLVNSFTRILLFGTVLLAWYIVVKTKREELFELARRAQNTLHTHGLQDFYIKGCALVALTAFIILNLVPITSADGLVYHLPFMQAMILHHGLDAPLAGITHIGFGYMPALAEALFAAFALLGSVESLVAPTTVLLLAITGAFFATLYTLLTPIIRRPALRLILVPLCFLMPDVRDITLFAGMIDMVVFSFMIVGFLLMVRGAAARTHELYLGALYIGAAVAMKYLGLVFAALVGMYCLFEWYRVPKERLERFWPFAFAGVIIVVIPAYWYVRNFIVMHNPVYPLLSGIGPDMLVVGSDFIPRTWWGYLFYPVLIYGGIFFGIPAARLGPLELLVVLFAIVGALYVLVVRREKTEVYRLVAVLLITALCYDWIVSTLSQITRYSMPSLLLFTILAVIVADQLLDRLPTWVEKKGYALFTIVFIVLLPFIVNVYSDRVRYMTGALPLQTYFERSLQDSTFTPELYRAETEMYGNVMHYKHY